MAHITPEPEPVLCIDCDTCELQHTDACHDCVMSFLLGAQGETPVVVDLAEVRAMRVMTEAGLAPPLRHVRSIG